MNRPHPSKLILLATALTGCHTAPPPAPASQTYHVHGTVMALDAPHNELTLKTEEIPNFMAPMTMSYPLTDPSAYSELHPGDVLTATLVLTPQQAQTMHLKDIVVIAQASPDYVPVQYHVPEPGDAVPNFTVLNQSGHTLGLQQFRGKVLVMTFIYTRCTLSDFCPRMSQNFAQIDKSLQSDPKLYTQTHLLSVSFDPAYDTPAVLRSYGGAYTGQYTRERFLHWDFAAPPVRDLQTMAQFFDVGVQSGEDRSISHSLSTVVIGKDGKVLDWYPTNDWNPADVVAEVKHAAAS